VTTPAPARPVSCEIAVALIDPPELAMREMMTDDGIDSLAESLRAEGQLHEIGVVPVGDRFEVIYGHRRRVALEHAGIATARCLVYPAGTTNVEALKVAENEERESVNPAAQAMYYRHLLQTRCGGDVRELVKLTGRKESHLLGRLELFRGDEEVFQELRAERITLAVALELNKIDSEMYRRAYLRDAIEGGWNSTVVRRKRQELEQTLRYNEAAAQQRGDPTAPSDVAPIESLDACPLCLSTKDTHDMIYVRIHRSCRDVYMRQRGGDDRA
jgi:ParB/RepB/Spo0J family partition protein